MLVGVVDRKLRVSPRTGLALSLALILAFPPGIFAEGIKWNGNGNDGSFGNPLNWDTNTVPGNTSDVTINTGAGDNVLLDVPSIVNSLALGGSRTDFTSSLQVNNGVNSLTLGTSASSPGNVLTVSNGGILNIGNFSGATLELSATDTSATIVAGGQINVQDGGSLVLRNTNGGSRTIQNDGLISLAGDFSALTLDEGGAGSTFTLAGSGTLTLDGNAQINSFTGTGDLINGSGHTISGNGLIAGQFTPPAGAAPEVSPTSFTNDGTLHASLGQGSSLTLDAALTNWNAGTNTLQGGTYVVDDGATLVLSSLSGAEIRNLTGSASVTVTGTGSLSGGLGTGTSNTLGGLTNITDSSLTLNGVSLNIAPGGVPATLTLAATSSGIPASLTLDSFTDSHNVTVGSNVVVNGAFTNSVDTTNASDNLANSSTLNVQGGSTLTTGAFLNQSRVGLFGTDFSNFLNADANVNVLDGSTLNVASLTTSTNNGFSNSNITITDSSLNVTNDVHQGLTDGGTNYSSGGENLTLNNSVAQVGGSFSNTNSLNWSNVNVNGSSLTVTGKFTQDQSNEGWGSSSLNLAAIDLGDGLLSSEVTLGGLHNSSLVFNRDQSNESAQSLVSLSGFSKLEVKGAGTFDNIGSNGVLSGGSYFIEGGSVLKYSGANINTLDAHTFVTLDNSQNVGNSPAFLNNGNDALSGSLTTVNGVLTLQNGASLTLTQQSLGVGSTGQVNVTDSTLRLQNSDTNGLTTLENNGVINVNGSSQTASLSLNDDGSASTFELTGTGTLNLAGQGRIFGQSGDESLINDVDHTISGNGFIGNLNLTNHGTITASDGNLILSGGGSGNIYSDGIMNAAAGATLTFQTASPGSLTTITNDGTINLLNLEPTSATANLFGGTLAFDGNQFVATASSFSGESFVLSGSGTVNMNGFNTSIVGVNGNENLLNDVNHTIAGSGVISDLYLTNAGTINATGGDLALDLTSSGVVTNNVSGNINIANGASLTIRDTSGDGSTIYNNGTIHLQGANLDPALVFDSGGVANTFTLSGSGAVEMSTSQTNAIYGASGKESLINDVDHTIRGGGTISSFAAFTNNGTLESTTGGTLIVDTTANLTNWNGGNNHLYGGNYVVDAGSTMQLSAIGSGQIQTLSGASVTLFGSGGLGPDGFLTGDNTTNAAAGISKIYSGSTGNASLELNGLSGTVALATDTNGLFTVAANDLNGNGDGSASLSLIATSATLGGDFVNRAKAYNDFNSSTANLTLDNGASLTIGTVDAPHNLTNKATANGENSFSTAIVTVNGGSTLTVNGNVSNTSIDNSIFGALAGAGVEVSNGSKLIVSGTYNNTGAFLGFAPGAILILDGGSTATVGGLFTNDENSLVGLNSSFSPTGASSFSPAITSLTTTGGFSNAGVVLLNLGSQLENTGSFANTGSLADVELSNGSTLINHGAFANSDGTVGVDGIGTTLQIHGTFDNTALSDFGAQLTLTGGSHATVDGLFTNDTGSFVDLDAACSCGLAVRASAISGGSTLTTLGGFSNAGQVTLNRNSTLDNTGTFTNTGLITLDNGSTLKSAPAVVPAASPTPAKTFENSGTITTGTVGGSNQINVTGALFNTSPGVVNLNGAGDQMTATGQFTNTGSVNLNGGGTKVSSDTGIDNQAGAFITLAGKTAVVSSSGAITNEGTIAFTAGTGKVSSDTGINNSGTITMAGVADILSTKGDLSNSGSVTIGATETVSVDGTYHQTAGTTVLDEGGFLTASEVQLSGGVLSGFGTVTGNLLIDGGTLAPGDPQSLDIIGNYTQTAGTLDLDILNFSDYDQIQITGNANLGGTLQITLDPNFDSTGINTNSLFQIISWTGTLTGAFSSFIHPTFNGYTFTQIFNANGHELDLGVTRADTSAAPEPSTFAMLFGAMMLGVAITWGRNRRRSGKVS